MKILFLNRSFWPDLEATGQLLTELCVDLGRSHEVTVVAGPSSYVRTVQRGLWTADDSLAPVRIVRTWGTRLAKRRLAGRLANLATYYALAAVAALRQPRPDVVVTETDPPLLGLLGALLRARWGCRFVYYCHDLYPDVARALGRIRSPAVRGLLAWGNRFAYRRADRILVLGDDMRERLTAAGVAAEKIEVLPNWVDCAAVHPVERSAFREQFGERFVAMYSGNIGLGQPLDVVLDAAARLRAEPRIVFVFIGDGASKRELEERTRRESLANVVFLPYQPKERLAESLSAADVHLVPLRSGLAGCMVPSKVYGILAAGRPFVAMMEEHADVARLARDAGVGFVLPPHDAAGLAELLRNAAADRARLQLMGNRARALALRCFDRPTATSRFAAMLQHVCESSP